MLKTQMSELKTKSHDLKLKNYLVILTLVIRYFNLKLII